MLARCQRDASVQLHLFERLHIVVPAKRLLQPGDVQVVHLVRRPNRGRHVPALVDVEHQLYLRTDRVTHRLHAVVIVLHRVAAADTADFELNRVVTGLDVTACFGDQLRNALAFAIISACYVYGNRIAVAAEKFVDRQTGVFGHEIIERGVDRRDCGDDGGLPPTAHGGLAPVGRGEHLLPDLANHERIFADHEIAEAFAEQVGSTARTLAFDRRIGHPEAFFQRLLDQRHLKPRDLQRLGLAARPVSLRPIGKRGGWCS